MADPRRLLAGLVLVALAVTVPAVTAAGQGVTGPFTAADYLRMQEQAMLPGIVWPDPVVMDVWVGVTGDGATDARIRELAELRGYERQPVAGGELVVVDGRELQAPAAAAWLDLRAEARRAGIDLALTSAHRDLGAQRSLFSGRLAGRSDAGIETTLRLAAPPGYSKHHTGYTIDVGSPGATGSGFGATRAYAWLAADDFAVARAFGWIPSYPEGGSEMGPEPEPWELTWIGPGRIECASGSTHPTGFCDVAGSPHVDDIAWLAELGVTVGCRPERFCPDDPLTRGDAASLLWRLHGAPEPIEESPFVDVYRADPFASAVSWLWAEGIVEGLTPTAFGPTEHFAADDVLAVLLRLSAAGGVPEARGLWGSTADDGGSTVETGGLGLFVSRAEFASVLRRWVAGA